MVEITLNEEYKGGNQDPDPWVLQQAVEEEKVLFQAKVIIHLLLFSYQYKHVLPF